ncbi:hypothetical protein ES319_D12G032700v1 [Gossypium barbadense]|uniref:Uncharacterized protein n=1 Tax=Gossypium barbadense TaxID=3634 RepID=A0A5J5NTI0_GOSBA|nr:hypothetical protein ES319_D12G032700v1 [Gossypium barbadense]
MRCLSQMNFENSGGIIFRKAIDANHAPSWSPLIIPLLCTLYKYSSCSFVVPPTYKHCGCNFIDKAFSFRDSFPTNVDSAFNAKEKGGSSLIWFFSAGVISKQSWRPCPNLPHPKQKIGSFSYLKGIQNLFTFPIETKIPLRRGLCTFNCTLSRQNSPNISDLITPP